MIDFICNQCFKKSKAETMEEVIKHEKICVSCINENRKKSIKKYKKIEKEKQCEVCGAFFMSRNCRACSDECRKKLNEKTRFYKNLEKANNEIRITKIRVYGQGKYEQVNFIGDIINKMGAK